jgi:Family of unknown function (DUF5397)
MLPTGFAEAQATYIQAGDASFIGQVRRFGDAGPAYEVVSVAPTGDLQIVVVESGERLVYGQQEFAADPLAETIP